MSQTVRSKARELLETEGKESAIAFFEERIKKIGEPKSFQDVYNISVNKIVIKWINDQVI